MRYYVIRNYAEQKNGSVVRLLSGENNRKRAGGTGVGTERREWEEWLEDARAYYSEHGALAVPMEYETAEGSKLGVWPETQRRKRGKRLDRPRLTEDQIRQLPVFDGKRTESI